MTDFMHSFFAKKRIAMDSNIAKSNAHHTLLLRTDVTVHVYLHVCEHDRELLILS